MTNADGNVFLTAADAAGVVETAAAQATEYAGSVNARERNEDVCHTCLCFLGRGE